MNWFWLSGMVVALDQVTKYIADNNLDLRVPEEVFSGLNMTLCYNKGAAFSFLSNAGGWQRWLFMSISFVVSLVIIHCLRNVDPKRASLSWGLALILGGAIGNLIDRSLYGYVIDFIDVYYGHWHYPAFNVADTAISIGAGLLIIDIFTNNEPCFKKTA